MENDDHTVSKAQLLLRECKTAPVYVFVRFQLQTWAWTRQQTKARTIELPRNAAEALEKHVMTKSEQQGETSAFWLEAKILYITFLTEN